MALAFAPDDAEAEGTAVVTPEGVLEEPLPAGLLDDIEAAAEHGPVVVDLTEVTLTARRPVVALLDALAEAGVADRACLVCPRSTARALLRSWGIDEEVAVFATWGDAAQARVLQADGYGPGWTAEHPHRPER